MKSIYLFPFLHINVFIGRSSLKVFSDIRSLTSQISTLPSFSVKMEASNGMEMNNLEREYIRRQHHKHELVENQCSSTVVKHIQAPVHIVTSLLINLLSSNHLTA